jgi:Domain of unknown function (DUF3472)/Domain of unknown function (DUF5077)
MTRCLLRIAAPIVLAAIARAELRVPAFTAYLEPERGARVSSRSGVADWRSAETRVLWFGEIKHAGKLEAAVAVRVPEKANAKFTLTVAGQARDAAATGGDAVLKFGAFDIAKPGYVRFELASDAKDTAPLAVDALILDGPAVADAHFNVEPRRNAASVHLAFATPKDANVAVFYNEMTGVDDPVATYYMACGFSRGYFGMQVNSPTERRIIFSVWDAASGQDAKDRSTVAAENHTQLVAKGDGVHASVFGNEGTGGHSHLKYMWKTGSTQRFAVAVKPDGTFTDYSGWWFHPDDKKWMLIATFRAPKDGKWLRGLYSFSENFGGGSGHLRRKALFGPQWLRTDKGEWREVTEASFSHDPTGKTARLDRFMGVEDGRFFLSHGGFVAGFTKFGEKFTRPATGTPPADVPDFR